MSAPATVVDRIPFALTEISREAREAAGRVLASGWVTTGPEVAEFEREFAAWVGAEHAVAVSSCTAAIELALRSMRLPPGSKVLTSTMTFCGAVHAIVHAGLRPVLADVDPITLMPDARTTAAAARRAGGVDAMVVLHFAGFPAAVDQLAEAAGLPTHRVIEDAAHALGSRLGERPIGTLSAATCFSFYATKNLPVGEGGMITTDDPELASFVTQARLHGMSHDAWRRYLPGAAHWRYTVAMDGIKANMTDLQAAIGRAQLRHLPRWQERRVDIARRFDFCLSGIDGVATPAWPEEGLHSWHLYVIRIQPAFGLDRDAVISALSERGIDCSVHFIPLHHQPYFVDLLGSEITRQFPCADQVFEEIVSLPLYPSLSDTDVDRICHELSDLQRGPLVGARDRRAPLRSMP